MNRRNEIPAAARAFMTLGNEGGDPPSQRSRPRTAFALVTIALWVMASPVLWVSNAMGSTSQDPVAVAAKDEGEDNSGPGSDNSGPGSGDDDDATTTSGNGATTGTATTSARDADG